MSNCLLKITQPKKNKVKLQQQQSPKSKLQITQLESHTFIKVKLLEDINFQGAFYEPNETEKEKFHLLHTFFYRWK